MKWKGRRGGSRSGKTDSIERSVKKGKEHGDTSGVAGGGVVEDAGGARRHRMSGVAVLKWS